MISVVIPLYNKEKNIAKTLQSVLQQTYKNFEIVVINDGSTDNSINEVLKLKDDRIRIINQLNSGVSAARNKGIIEAKYDLIAFIDADDEWLPEYLQTQYDLYIKYPNCSIFVCNYKFKTNSGTIINTKINKLPFKSDDGILTNYFTVATHSHPPITSISIMVKKNAILKIGGFPVKVTSGEDLITWAKLATNYNIAYSKKVLACYNLGEGYDYSKLPPRKQDQNDFVGNELKRLYKIYPDTAGLKRYISLWHKMRASVAIRFGDKAETIHESIKSLYFYPLNFKVILFIILTVLPTKIRKKIISKYK